MRPAEWPAAGVFGAWLLLALLVHVPALKPHIRGWDVLSLVPEWTFFAPRPAEWDYHLLFRDVYADGGVTSWAEVKVAEERAWWNFVWNPDRRGRKALFDAVTELAVTLADARAAQGRVAVEGSIPYLTLLNQISALPRLGTPERTQFLVLSSSAAAASEPQVVYLSELHAL